MRGRAVVAAVWLPSIMLCSAAAQAAGDTTPALLREQAELNSLCRGGSGDDPRTIAACKKRDAVSRALGGMGWCFGKEGEFEYQKQWHRCQPGSIRIGQ